MSDDTTLAHVPPHMLDRLTSAAQKQAFGKKPAAKKVEKVEKEKEKEKPVKK